MKTKKRIHKAWIICDHDETTKAPIQTRGKRGLYELYWSEEQALRAVELTGNDRLRVWGVEWTGKVYQYVLDRIYYEIGKHRASDLPDMANPR